jgi:hypothetical protein
LNILYLKYLNSLLGDFFMKKTIAIVAVLAAALSFASAKSYSFTFGAHGFFGEGWGASWDDGQNVPSDATKPFAANMLYGGGAFVNLPINGTVGIQPEVNYMVNNAGYTGTSTTSILGVSATVTSANTLTYSSVDIPVFLTFKAQKFTLLAGPYISIPVSTLNCAYTTTGSTNLSSSTGTSSGSSQYDLKKPVFGLALGANVAERMGGQYLILGARYMLDFSPVTTVETSNNTTTETKIYTRRGLTLDAGIRFAL